MNIEFSGEYDYYQDTGVVSFDAFIDGLRVIFKITDEALQDHFPDLGDSVRIFLANRVAIEEIARKIVYIMGIPDSKIVMIKTKDLAP